MPYNRKMFLRGQVYELCFRTEEGLPMTSAPFMILLLQGYLAAAQTLYPVEIIACVFMGNHVHLLIRVIDPGHVPCFCEYFKRESSHAINRLQGRINHTVWCTGYDSPIVLDGTTVINRLCYFYCNPVRAGLTESIDHYPHISSWNAFVRGQKETKVCSRLPRSSVPVLPNGPLTDRQLSELEEYVREHSIGEYELTFDPHAWLDCFDESTGGDPEKIRAEVIRRVRQVEDECKSSRAVPVVGTERLMRQDIRQKHIPKKRGRRMICLGASKSIRKIFIGFYKELAEAAKLTIRAIRAGARVAAPPSFFAPSGVLHANLLLSSTPLPLA